MNREVSIIVCCYNSANRLAESLKHLSAQETPENFFIEVIIVDNACTDGTADVAITFWQSLGTPHTLRVVHESTPGLTNARIKGILEARHEIIIFCDDDNWLCPTYARTAFEIMDGNPKIALAGGPAIAEIESPEVPDWFYEVKGVYAVGGGDGACEISKDGIIRGAGMVARKSQLLALLDSGFEFICSDRKGTSLSSGGDLEICHAMRWLGHVLYHDGRLKLRHFIPEERLKWSYVVNACKGFGEATLASDPFRLIEKRNQPIRNSIRMFFVYHILRGTLTLVPLTWSLLTMYHSEGKVEVLKAAGKLGRLRGIIGLNFSYGAIIASKAQWLEHNAPNLRDKSD